MQSLSHFIPQLVTRLGVTERNYEVISLVEREIHKYAPKSTVSAYKNNKIYVEAESSTHLYELNFRRREILKILSVIPGMHETELKIFLKGCSKPSAEERLKSRKKITIERN